MSQSYKIVLLKNVNLEELLIDYLVQDVPNVVTIVPTYTIDYDLVDLLDENSRHLIQFKDHCKNNVKTWGIMIDIDILPPYTNKPCWNCHHTFKTSPLGCPLRYHPSHVQSPDKIQMIKEYFKKINLPEDMDTDYFETEGLFCSFPCIKRYIIDQGLNTKYKRSLTLLSLLYKKINNCDVMTIPIASKWKVIATYGGHIPIEKYRASFDKLFYYDTINEKRPYMFNSSTYATEVKL